MIECSSNLKELSLHNNPLESPPPFIYSKGLIQLQRYMSEVRASLLVDTPREEFIFTRDISFAEGRTFSFNFILFYSSYKIKTSSKCQILYDDSKYQIELERGE